MSVYPVPGWLRAFAESVPDLGGDRFSRFLPPPEGGRRHSAVLVLFAPDTVGDAADGSRVVITERAHSMRSHAGQPAFPGGATEEGDLHAADTALREAWEEIDLDRGGVEVLAELPTLHIPVSGYDVTPVVGWWRSPDPASLWAKDPREVARVVQPTVGELVDPARRFRVRHPSGFVGPAWDVEGLLVWGFTAGILDRVLDLAGMSVPWDTGRVRDLPA
ncbi:MULTISPECIES: NUDIX hydrolase [Ornithinimicrobium]|uniref:NUDIX hydrolase n=1 Tax=Ornithinimicrobium kibberense TaxID=282060 RepID=A0ABV5V1B5_9MICO|nr:MULTISPECIES: CoA pyrophosphatase [Ornithinimicrobium]OLT21425.1 coenzyme A pyrophosphatase [Ornithinimicrobium sp. CNJ-824]